MNDPADLAIKLINFKLASQTATRMIIVPVKNYIFLKRLKIMCTICSPMTCKNLQIPEKSNILFVHVIEVSLLGNLI